MKNLILWGTIVTFCNVLPCPAYTQGRGDDRSVTKANIEQLSQKIDKLDQKVDNLKVYVDTRLDEMDKRLGSLIAVPNPRIDATKSKRDFLMTILMILFGGNFFGLLIWLFHGMGSYREATKGLTPKQRVEALELIRSMVKT